MARPRQRRTEYPIPYVHVNHGAVVYRPWFPPDQREGIQTTTAGFLSPPVHLGKPGDPPEMIYQAWLAARESLRLQHTSTRHTLGWIMEQYFNSTQFQQLSKASQSNSRFMARLLEHPLHSIEIETSPAAIPEALHVNINHLEIGGDLRVSDIIDMPAGAVPQVDANEVVVACVAPMVVDEEQEAGGSVEPEVIGKADEEGGEE